jgi:hypothetical protein
MINSANELEKDIAKLVVKSRHLLVMGQHDEALKVTRNAVALQDEIIRATEIAVQLTQKMLAEQKSKRADIDVAIAHLAKTKTHKANNDTRRNQKDPETSGAIPGKCQEISQR